MKLRDGLITVFVLAIAAGALFLWFSDSGLRSAPNARLTLLDGSSVAVEDLRGKTVVVNFWATTCVGCRREVPHLVELRKQYGAQGLEVLGVAMSYDPVDQVNEFVKRFAMEYPVGVDNGDAIANAFGDVRLVPTTFVLSPEGRIVFQKLGEFTPEEIDGVLSKYLKPST